MFRSEDHYPGLTIYFWSDIPLNRLKHNWLDFFLITFRGLYCFIWCWECFHSFVVFLIYHHRWLITSTTDSTSQVIKGNLGLRRSVVSDSLRPHGLQPARLLCPWGFSRQEYQSGLPYPSPGDLHNTGIKPGLPHCRRILYYVSYTREPSLPSESPAKDKRELLIRWGLVM